MAKIFNGNKLKELLGEDFIVAVKAKDGVHCIASGDQGDLIDMLGSMCDTYLEEEVIDVDQLTILAEAVIAKNNKEETTDKDNKKLLS